jgi:hypothetical protein
MPAEFHIKIGKRKRNIGVFIDTPTFKKVKKEIAKLLPDPRLSAVRSRIYTRTVLGGKCAGPLNVIVAFENEILPSLTISVKEPECETCFALLSLSTCITDGKCAKLP